jgi:hypothetical protein
LGHFSRWLAPQIVLMEPQANQQLSRLLHTALPLRVNCAVLSVRPVYPLL